MFVGLRSFSVIGSQMPATAPQYPLIGLPPHLAWPLTVPPRLRPPRDSDQAQRQVSNCSLLDLCASSLRKAHACLPCVVPTLTDDPRRESYSVKSERVATNGLTHSFPRVGGRVRNSVALPSPYRSREPGLQNPAFELQPHRRRCSSVCVFSFLL